METAGRELLHMAQCNENWHMHFLHEQEDSPQKKNDLEDQNYSEREHGSFLPN